MKVFLWLVLTGGIIAAVFHYATRPDYGKLIASTQGEIRSEYEKRPGVRVVDVELIKESDHKLTGFVKLKVNDAVDMTQSCTVTLDDDFSHYLYSCSP